MGFLRVERREIKGLRSQHQSFCSPASTGRKESCGNTTDHVPYVEMGQDCVCMSLTCYRAGPYVAAYLNLGRAMIADGYSGQAALQKEVLCHISSSSSCLFGMGQQLYIFPPLALVSLRSSSWGGYNFLTPSSPVPLFNILQRHQEQWPKNLISVLQPSSAFCHRLSRCKDCDIVWLWTKPFLFYTDLFE